MVYRKMHAIFVNFYVFVWNGYLIVLIVFNIQVFLLGFDAYLAR